MLSETVEDVRLDVPIECRDGAFAQFNYFPPELVRAAGKLGIGIELSSYAASDQDDEDNGDSSA